MPKAKTAAATADGGDNEYAECKPGVGGYQLAVYKKNNLKRLEPLGEEVYSYVTSKLKKHQGVLRGKKVGGGEGVQESHKKIKKEKAPKNKKKDVVLETGGEAKESATASAAAKPKRILSEKQKEALARGREKRKEQLLLSQQK